MIYFIRGKESGNIKIGFSNMPKKRKTNLQTAHYEELEFIGFMNGSREDEARIHEMFTKFRIRGEWYRPAPDLIDFVTKSASKSETNRISSLGKGEYRITFADPEEYTMAFFLAARSHRIRILSDSETQFILGVEGEKGVLLDWLGSLYCATKRMVEEVALLISEQSIAYGAMGQQSIKTEQ